MGILKQPASGIIFAQDSEHWTQNYGLFAHLALGLSPLGLRPQVPSL
jgi:hypothetical protein